MCNAQFDQLGSAEPSKRHVLFNGEPMLEGWRSSIVTLSSDVMQEVVSQPEFTNVGVNVSKTTLVLCPGPSREEDRPADFKSRLTK